VAGYKNKERGKWKEENRFYFFPVSFFLFPISFLSKVNNTKINKLELNDLSIHFPIFV